jgi:hypothetical protein
MSSVFAGGTVTVRVGIAAWLLLTSFVCLNAADADPHWLGAGHPSDRHPGTHEVGQSTLEASTAHLECRDEVAPAVVGASHLKVVLYFAGMIGAGGPDLVAFDAGSRDLVSVWTGPPPLSQLSSSPLRT